MRVRFEEQLERLNVMLIDMGSALRGSHHICS